MAFNISKYPTKTCPICSKVFPHYPSKRNSGRAHPKLRFIHSVTCSPTCSRIWARKQQSERKDMIDRDWDMYKASSPYNDDMFRVEQEVRKHSSVYKKGRKIIQMKGGKKKDG